MLTNYILLGEGTSETPPKNANLYLTYPLKKIKKCIPPPKKNRIKKKNLEKKFPKIRKKI